MNIPDKLAVRVYPTGPVGQPIAGYLAEVGEPLLGEGWAVFADSSPSEPTKREAMAALRDRLERRLVYTLMALEAIDTLADGLTVTAPASTWTARPRWVVDPPFGAGFLRFGVEAGEDGTKAVVIVPDTDEGRATVALMVAAMQMREALAKAGCQRRLQPCGVPPLSKCAVCAALETSKKLPGETQ